MTPDFRRIRTDVGESLALDWYAARPGARTVLYVPGLGSHRRGEKTVYFAERFNERGWGYASLDLRGHGESDGRMRDVTMSGMLADISAALDWIGRQAPAAGTVLIGASLGAAVIAWHALAHPAAVGPLIMLGPSLWFPANLLADLGYDAVEDWRTSGLRRLRNDWIDLELGYGLVEDARRYDPAVLNRRHATPTLMIHGMQDATVDWHATVEFARGCTAPVADVLLIGSGDHRLTAHKELLFDVLWDWLGRQGPGRPDERTA